MKHDYNLKRAEKKYIKDIMDIESCSFASGICEDEKTFLSRLELFNDGFYVLELNGRVAGYICSEIWEFQKDPDRRCFDLGHNIRDYHDVRGTELYISSMGLHPVHRGKGAGRYMFEQALKNICERYPHLETQILIVSDKWQKAIQIYRKNGFRELFTIDNFFMYKNNQSENGIVMRNYRNKLR